MRVLITGGNGQLGTALVNNLNAHWNVIALGKSQLDVTDHSQVENIVLNLMPDVIINTAAFTLVDQCEYEKKKAFEVNSLGAFHVAKEAKKIGAKLVYISTDYVFSGDKLTPYVEEDVPNPKNVYGLSKWIGEKLVQSTIEEAYIIRTSWLYGSSGNNFVKTMLKLAENKEDINVVNDQVGSPTNSKDLAEVILHLIGKPYGIYHVSNSGSCTWYTFAKHILTIAGFDPNAVKPTTTEAFGAPALRPTYSVLDHKALERENIKCPRHWKDAVNEFLSEVLNR